MSFTDAYVPPKQVQQHTQDKQTLQSGMPSPIASFGDRNSPNSSFSRPTTLTSSPTNLLATSPKAIPRQPHINNLRLVTDNKHNCANCKTTNTPVWRRDFRGRHVCNACGIYSRVHKLDRPLGIKRKGADIQKKGISSATTEMCNLQRLDYSQFRGNIKSGGQSPTTPISRQQNYFLPPVSFKRPIYEANQSPIQLAKCQIPVYVSQNQVIKLAPITMKHKPGSRTPPYENSSALDLLAEEASASAKLSYPSPQSATPRKMSVESLLI